MARKSTPKPRNEPETIPISAFRDIHLHFPGDVYSLALWVAWSDRAKSTPTRHRQTTLAGLASHFATLYGLDYERPIYASDVMTVFRSHGLQGNPVLCLDDEASADHPGVPTDGRGSLGTPARLAAPRANSPSALAPPAESVSQETPAPPTRPPESPPPAAAPESREARTPPPGVGLQRRRGRPRQRPPDATGPRG